MKKYIFIIFFSYFVLFSCHAFAQSSTCPPNDSNPTMGCSSLTTYYPPPTATYNTIKLTTNANSLNCVKNSTSCQNGTIYVDSKGTLNVWEGHKAVIYPQECYNKFCSWDTSTGGNSNSCNLANPCQTGFTSQSVDAAGDLSKTFTTSPTVSVRSWVCCSGMGGSPTGGAVTGGGPIGMASS